MYIHPLYGFVDDGEDIEAAIDEQLEHEEREAERREQELRDTLQRNLERHGPIQANASEYDEYIAKHSGDRM